ncbi:hypothetical protein F5879DRAFT_145369 [Lentinula edodes]|uniref:uncharacterized protein n=1 Tax=Lentinula edodes TaxID=5353 RepID=UPI001E8E35C6|nr:uncharacterized protein C8R40DRAFT_605529 [Lentinula edodes]KAH7870981.1 hypothetical protein C8R40DRAFT_605529 [Lentinula edodes]KAJ3903528.1 hypothetical protein F5879DRAFT_145369 [Lentinula edodes]
MISQVMPGNTLERSQVALKEEYVTEYSLKQAMGDQDVAGWQSLDQYIQIREYGCTCGSCEEGWLSPRMKFCLQATAELYGDMIEDAAVGFTPRKPIRIEDSTFLVSSQFATYSSLAFSNLSILLSGLWCYLLSYGSFTCR